MHALILMMAFVAPCAAEEVEHPIYRSWAKYPVGTSITTKSVTKGVTREGVEATITTTVKTTLAQVDDQKIVLEKLATSDATGVMTDSPVQTYEQRRMFPLLPGIKAEDVGKPLKASKNGEETIKVLGKEIKAVWFDSSYRGDAGEVFTRTWMNDDYPGRMVKSSTKVPGGKSSTEIEVIEFKVPGKD